MVEKVYEKKICLITGGAGFLGKNIVSFLKNDYLVFCIDNNKKKLQSLRSLKKIILKILKSMNVILQVIKKLRNYLNQ